MIDVPVKLSATGRAMLMLAATRENNLVRPPDLPAAAARQVVRSLLNNGLVEEVPAPIDDPAHIWREAEDGTKLTLRATNQGLAAIGEAATARNEDPPARDTTKEPDAECHATHDALEPSNRPDDEAPREPDTAAGERTTDNVIGDTEAAHDTPVAPTRASLRRAAQAVLDAWADEANRDNDISVALEGPMADLRAALTGAPLRVTTSTSRKPREGTKQEQVLAMLRHPDGATVAQIAEATGWQSHTVRGFFAGLKKKGFVVEAVERVRLVGPDKSGAKGSYTVYRLNSEPEA